MNRHLRRLRLRGRQPPPKILGLAARRVRRRTHLAQPRLQLLALGRQGIPLAGRLRERAFHARRPLPELPRLVGGLLQLRDASPQPSGFGAGLREPSAGNFQFNRERGGSLGLLLGLAAGGTQLLQALRKVARRGPGGFLETRVFRQQAGDAGVAGRELGQSQTRDGRDGIRGTRAGVGQFALHGGLFTGNRLKLDAQVGHGRLRLPDTRGARREARIFRPHACEFGFGESEALGERSDRAIGRERRRCGGRQRRGNGGGGGTRGGGGTLRGDPFPFALDTRPTLHQLLRSEFAGDEIAGDRSGAVLDRQG